MMGDWYTDFKIKTKDIQVELAGVGKSELHKVKTILFLHSVV